MYYRGYRIGLIDINAGDSSFLITKKGTNVIIGTACSVSNAINLIDEIEKQGDLFELEPSD